MRNAERAIVYSLLAVSIFLGLTRSVGRVSAEDATAGQAKFSKVTILAPNGQPAIVLDSGWDGGRIQMFTGGRKEPLPPQHVRTVPDVNLGISLEAGKLENTITTCGQDEKQGVVLRTRANGGSSVSALGPGGARGVEMSSTMRSKDQVRPTKQLLWNGITTSEANGETGIMLRTLEDGRGTLYIRGVDGSSSLNLLTESDGRAMACTSKGHGNRGFLLETTKDGSSSVKVYAADGNLAAQMP